MNLFIKRIILFPFIATIIIVVMAVLVAILQSVIVPKISVPQDKNILIMGNSHTECAINDNIFKRSINLSRSSRELVSSANYIQKILNDNPQIDTVLLSVHYGLLSGNWGNKRGLQISESIWCSRYFSKLLYYLRYEPEIILHLASYPFTPKGLQRVLSDNINHIGGYLYLERDKLEKNIEIDSEEFPHKAQIDTTSLDYNELIKLKKNLDFRGVHLILIDTPKYNPNNRIIEQTKFHSLIKEYLSDFDYVDYVDFPLMKEFYGDITHLNHKGAKIFSEYLEKYGISDFRDIL